MPNIVNVLTGFIKAIRPLSVPRIEDIPYWTSPPIEFVYESTANLSFGTYVWNDSPSALSPTRPLQENALYYFRHITFTADIEELDYNSNITTTPSFQTYLKSLANVQIFREPIIMAKYLEAFDYRLVWQTHEGEDDQLLGGFTGTLTQGPTLVGKTSVTLKAIIAAQEIIDDGYINLFKEKYPAPYSAAIGVERGV